MRVRSFHDNASGTLHFCDASYEFRDALPPGETTSLAELRGENADVALSALLAVSAAEGYEMVYCHLLTDTYPRSYEVIEGLWGDVDREPGDSVVDYFLSIAFSSEEK